jgi:peptide/nickel transport system permease protein
MSGRRAKSRQRRSRPAGRVFGLVVIGLLCVLAVFGPALSPHDPNEQDIARRLEGPSVDHWLGTDHLGRDVASRLIAGVRIGLTLGLPVVLIALAIGLSIGLASGYRSGRVDMFTLFVIDFIAAFPGLILALVMIPLLGVSTQTLILVLVVAFIPGYVRVTRASVLGVKERGFVLAERALGASSWRVTVRHILPNIIGPILILAAIDIPVVIVAEAGLSFLGLGVPPPDASWGSMLFEGFSRVRDAPGPVLWPAAAIAVTTVAFTLVGESFSTGRGLERVESTRLEHVT